MNPTLPNELPLWELESRWTHEFSKGNFRGQNSLDWRVPYTIGNLLRHRCLKWARMSPFGYLKHKLWPKEGLRVKLPIWLQTIKSQESPWFTCVQVACLISLESSWWGLELYLDLISIKGLKKTYGLPKLRESQFWESRDSQLGSPGTKWHLGESIMARHKE
jgi:hypothetical protein